MADPMILHRPHPGRRVGAGDRLGDVGDC